VPLQAGHIASTMSDFVSLIMRGSPVANYPNDYLHVSEIAQSIARSNLEQQG
jgi:hypothetical protein